MLPEGIEDIWENEKRDGDENDVRDDKRHVLDYVAPWLARSRLSERARHVTHDKTDRRQDGTGKHGRQTANSEQYLVPGCEVLEELKQGDSLGLGLLFNFLAIRWHDLLGRSVSLSIGILVSFVVVVLIQQLICE